jgi:hypothetical protein
MKHNSLCRHTRNDGNRKMIWNIFSPAIPNSGNREAQAEIKKFGVTSAKKRRPELTLTNFLKNFLR